MGSFLAVVRVLFLSLLVSAVVAKDKACKNPKVRREWRTLSPSQQQNWVDSVNCLATLPHNPNLVSMVPANVSLIPPINEASSFYDDFVYMHMDLNVQIHFTGMFLPWHRYYIQYFEDAIVKCGYKGALPYWDWTLDAGDFANSKFFDNSSHGVGGFGDPDNDYQIYTGGFKDQVRAYPNPHHIRRNVSLFPFSNPDAVSPFANDPNAPRPPADYQINVTMTRENVDYNVNNFEGDFMAFHAYFESPSGSHGGAHLILAGDMTGYCPKGAPSDCRAGPKWTPNDPLFFLHHAMVDKIWWDWQEKSIQSKYSYGGGSVAAINNFTTFTQFRTGLPPYLSYASEIPGSGLWNVTIWDIMDTTGDLLCYTYA